MTPEAAAREANIPHLRTPSSDPPRAIKLIDEPDFRLVRVEIGDNTEHVLEVRDGCDAMGLERWRKFEINGTTMRVLFRYLIRIADLQER